MLGRQRHRHITKVEPETKRQNPVRLVSLSKSLSVCPKREGTGMQWYGILYRR